MTTEKHIKQQSDFPIFLGVFYGHDSLVCPTWADFHEKMKGRPASNSLPPSYVLQITDNQHRKFCSRIDDDARLGTGTVPVIWQELEIAYDL